MDKEKDTKGFLGEIYRGARMGVETIDNVMSKVVDEGIKHELKYQLDRYEAIEKESYEELSKRGSGPDDIPVMQKAMAKMSIAMNTAMDNSPSHIAELLIKGNTMGVTGITRSLHDHSNADSNVVNLAQRFISLEQENIERLKKYL